MLFFRFEHIRIGRNKYAIVLDWGEEDHLVQIYSCKYHLPSFLYHSKYNSSLGYLRKIK